MSAPDPTVVERQMYLDMLSWSVDDPSYSMGDLRNLTGGGANAHRAVEAGTNNRVTDVGRSLMSASTPYTARQILGGETFVNVKDYGAIGDGVADDTDALREAIATGKNVYIPAGLYNTASLTLSLSQIVFGDGMSQTTINNISTGSAIIFEGVTFRTICDLGIVGHVSSTTSHGIELRSSDVAYVNIHRVRIYQAGGHGIYGGHIGNVNNVNIVECNIQGCYIDGINMEYLVPGTNEMNAIWINHCNIVASARNGITFSGNSFHITENTIQVNRGLAVSLYEPTASPLVETAVRPTYGSSINSNYFEGNCYNATLPASVSPIELFVGTQGGSGFNRLVRGLEIANNFFNESAAKYRSLIHVTDSAGTSDTAARHSVIRTSSNFGKIRLLTWSGVLPLSAGFTVDEDNHVLVPPAMRDALPIQVRLTGNYGVYGIGTTPLYRRIITRSGTYTFNGMTEAGCLIRMTNAGPVDINLHTYDNMEAGHIVTFAVTGTGTVTFPVTGGATILGATGPFSTGSIIVATRLSPTEWILSS